MLGMVKVCEQIVYCAIFHLSSGVYCIVCVCVCVACMSVSMSDYTFISERELKFMFAICHRPSVCLSSVVCNVGAPYSGD